MASFSVSTNMYLRQVYAPNRGLCVKANRADATNKTLISADSSALGKAIKTIGSFNFSDDSKINKDKFSKTLKSFTDAYNYTISSSNTNKEGKISVTSKKIKQLTSKYEDELKSLGISVKNGYMSISSTASTNISPDKYEELFGKDSEYMKELSKYAKKMNRTINYSIWLLKILIYIEKYSLMSAKLREYFSV